VRRPRCSDLRLPATAGLPSPALFKNFRMVHICSGSRDVKIFSISKLDKKWRNMYRLTFCWLSFSFGPRQDLAKAGFSLVLGGMFPDGAISFPVRLQKIPCSDAQGISEYRVEIAELFGAVAWVRHTQRAKFPVFSQLAGIFRSSWRVPLSRRQYLVEGSAATRWCRTAFQNRCRTRHRHRPR
jgi:hypothetical protein